MSLGTIIVPNELNGFVSRNMLASQQLSIYEVHCHCVATDILSCGANIFEYF